MAKIWGPILLLGKTTAKRDDILQQASQLFTIIVENTNIIFDTVKIRIFIFFNFYILYFFIKNYQGMEFKETEGKKTTEVTRCLLRFVMQCCFRSRPWKGLGDDFARSFVFAFLDFDHGRNFIFFQNFKNF